MEKEFVGWWYNRNSHARRLSGTHERDSRRKRRFDSRRPAISDNAKQMGCRNSIRTHVGTISSHFKAHNAGCAVLRAAVHVQTHFFQS